MGNAKKYILTSLTLGLIAASGALLIAGTNMLTRGPIAEYEQKKISDGIINIFGDNALVKETNNIDSNTYTYVKVRYVIADENDAPLGYAFRTDGSNSYGKISLIIGFNSNYDYKGLTVITNEQSFATTLNKNYINLIKDGEKTVDDVSVSCGATYGATTVKEMVQEAKKAAEELAGV